MNNIYKIVRSLFIRIAKYLDRLETIIPIEWKNAERVHSVRCRRHDLYNMIPVIL